MTSFSLFSNDPLYRLLAPLRLIRNGTLRIIPSIAFLILLTWCPVALLALLDGVAIGSSARTSFLFDFAAYAQFFVAVPLSIIAEVLINEEIRYGVEYLRCSGIVQKTDLAHLEERLSVASRMRASRMATVGCGIIGYALTGGWLLGELMNGVETWRALSAGLGGLTWAGWWHGIVSVPILFFWALRWAWKIGIWYWFLWQVSRMDLQLAAGHPDRFAGLGFLSRLQSRFAILIFALGCIIAATIGYKIVIEKASVTVVSVWAPIVAYIVLAPVAFLIPLFFFSQQLYRTKRRGLLNYSALVTCYMSKIEKTLKASGNEQAALLLSDDVSPLSDLTAYFENARKMHVLPFEFAFARRLFVSALGPMVPLLLEILHLPKVIAEFLVELFK